MPPLPTCNISPSVTDSLLCENYVVTLGVAEDMLPELSTSFSLIELGGLHFVPFGGDS